MTVDTRGRKVLILFRPWGSAPSFLAAELMGAPILSLSFHSWNYSRGARYDDSHESCSRSS